MGSGKSTVGKIISDELFLNFFDTDEEIESRTGHPLIGFLILRVRMALEKEKVIFFKKWFKKTQ